MTRYYVDISQWAERYYQEAANQFHLDKMLLVEVFYRLRGSAETHPENYLSTMERGYLLAEQLGEPCWRFFYAYWRWEVLMLYMERQTEGLNWRWKWWSKPVNPNTPIVSPVARCLPC